ncbi:MAG: hypothetical protein IJG17_05445, partial [Eubacterium sp.]|nr:hypothetical protein [Eubacterium sp.]
MKNKVVSICLAAVLAASVFAGCGESDQNAASAGSAAASSAASAAEETAEAASSAAAETAEAASSAAEETAAASGE